MPRRIRDEDEQDAYTAWRHVLPWKAGERKAIKRRTHRRERREARTSIREQQEDT